MRYFVRAALRGSPMSVIERAVPDLREELEARIHLCNPRVAWNSRANCVIIEVEEEAVAPQSAGGSVYDDVLESACAVLGTFEFIRVEILNVTASLHN